MSFGGNQLESGWRNGGGGPQFEMNKNNFGESPANTWSNNSGPYFQGNNLASKPSRDAALAPFLGFPSKADIPDPYDSYDIENYQLPDGFKGSRPYMKYIILKQVSTADEYPFREMAPFVRNDSSQEITWDVWIFNNHMLGRTPEESVSRLLTMQETQSRESMVRFGIALMLEHGFYKTPKGRENYRRNMDQISTAVSTTLAQGAMFACYNSHYTDPNDKYRSQASRGLADMAKLFHEEKDNWACVQRKENGWINIYGKCKNKLKNRVGREGNYTVVPSGMSKYIAERPENKYFVYTGIPGGQRQNVMPHTGTLKESVAYPIGEHQPNDDIAIRERTIGGFFRMLFSDIQGLPSDKDYVSSMMDGKIYCEERDDYHIMKYKDIHKKLGLFEFKNPGKELTKIGEQFFRSFDSTGTWGGYLKSVGLYDRIVAQIAALRGDAHSKLLDLMDAVETNRILSASSPSSSPSSSSSSSGLPEAVSYEENPLAEFGRAVRGEANEQEFVDADGNTGFMAKLMQCISKKGPGVDKFTESDLRMLKQQLQLLDDAQSVNGSNSRDSQTLVQEFAGYIQTYPLDSALLAGSDALDFFLLHLASSLERADERLALISISQRYPDRRTELEKLLQSREFADAVGNNRIASELRQKADALSPRWILDPDDSTGTISLRVVPQDDRSEVVLKNPSLAYTLSAVNMAMFRLSNSQVNLHIDQVKNQGRIKINSAMFGQLADTTAVTAAYKRFSLFQFNATVSALYSVLRQRLRDHGSNIDYKVLVDELNACCPLRHPIKNDADQYRDDLVELFPVDKLEDHPKSLSCQWRFRDAFTALKELVLRRVVIGEPLNAGMVKASVNAISNMLHTKRGTTFFAHGASTSGEGDQGVSLASDYLAKWYHDKFVPSRIASRTPEEIGVEWSAFRAAAVQQVNAQQQELVSFRNQPAVREAFFTYYPTFVDKYILYAATKPTEAAEKLAWDVQGTVLMYAGDEVPMPANNKKHVTAAISVFLGGNATGYDPAIDDHTKFVAWLKNWLATDAVKAEVDRLDDMKTLLASYTNIRKTVRAAVRDYYDLATTEKNFAASAATGGDGSKNLVLGANLIKQLLDVYVIQDGLFAEYGIEFNLLPFYSVLGFRPFKRYLMGSMIHLMGLGEAAKTFYGFADFQLADNVAQKIHYGHFTMYAKTVVLRHDMIVRADNIVVYGGNGGNSTSIWDPNSEDHVEAFRANELENDVFLAAVAPNWEINKTTFMDITGAFAARLSPNEEAKRATDYGPMARILSVIWGWRAVTSPLNKEYVNQIAPKFNTLVFQEHQFIYDHATRGLTREIHGCGHWGDLERPGFAETVRGANMYFEGSAVKTVITS